KKDTVLAQLSNPDKQKELIQRQSDQEINFTKFVFFNRSPEREHRAQAKQHKEHADKLEPIIQKVTEQIGKLTLVAGRDGQIVGAPHRSTIGQWLKPGKSAIADKTINYDKPFFCEIGDPHRLQAHLILEQSDIHLIGLDRTAWLKVYGKAEKTYK